MTITAGTRIGSYEVMALIGAGGMGEVYRARDARLNRDVALKVLPEVFARDAQRMARFEREAKLLASLNHSNIAAIYGLEESAGIRALVMELVEGPTLAERIAAGPIPLDEVLPIAKQIAEAVEYAHEQNVIHRDLKPANIKVKPDGAVKVLDFGLAKAMSEEFAEAEMSNSPTLSMAATRQGIILGTAAYMSPEQARGKKVDRRTDIWAFGVVLFEMLTGRQAFEGEDVSLALAAVMKSEPEWNRLPQDLSPGMYTVLRRCLQKDPKQRLRDMGDVRLAMEGAFGTVGGQSAPEAPAPIGRLAFPGRMAWTIAAILMLVAGVASWGWWRATRPVEQPLKSLVRLDVDLGADVSLGSTAGADVAISSDGTRIVYVSQARLFTRRLDQPAATELVGTNAAYEPFFSPDGQWVAFFAGGKLKKVSVAGGAVIDLCVASTPRGGAWGEDGNIIAALTTAGGLSRVPSTGGAPMPLTELAQGEATHRWPQVLPGGKAILFTTNASTAAFDGANVEVMSLPDRRRKTLQRGGTYGRYLPSGHLVYLNRGTLFAVPFDLEKLEVHGSPVPLLDGVGYSVPYGSAQFDFSPNGTLLYRNIAGGSGLFTVQWLDSTGKTQPLLAKPGNYTRPRLSPDGQRLALQVADGSGQDLWIYEWQRDTMTRLTFGTTGATPVPVWTPDGRYIVFETFEGLSLTRTDGAGQPQSLTKSKNLQLASSFSPDGKRLAYYELNSTTGAYDLWTVPVETGDAGLRGGKPEPFLQTKFDQRQPRFSPDGKWLAYTSTESGIYQVYVRAFPDKGGKWQISNSGGMYPVWSRNGHEIFFRTEDSRMIMVAGYTVKGDSFVADKPRVWLDKPIADLGLTTNYDLAPDGKRIAALMPVEEPKAQQAQNHVIFLENSFDEVRRRTAASK